MWTEFASRLHEHTTVVSLLVECVCVTSCLNFCLDTDVKHQVLAQMSMLWPGGGWVGGWWLVNIRLCYKNVKIKMAKAKKKQKKKTCCKTFKQFACLQW